MSIVDEITRLTSAKANIKAAIEAKGVSVPSSAKLDAFPSYVSQIESGGGSELEDALLEGSLSGIYSNSRISKVKAGGFRGLSGLTSVDLPNVSRIGVNAFRECISLTDVSLPKLSTEDNGGYAFFGCSALSRVVLPRTTGIGPYDYASTGLRSVQSTDFPVAVRIGQYAFYSCRSLSYVSFPSATHINNSAFYSLSALLEAHFPRNAQIEFGSSVFYNCHNLSVFDCPYAQRIGVEAFGNCYALQSVVFNRVSEIMGSAFYRCTGLKLFAIKSATISTTFNPTGIHRGQFMSCSSLESFYIFTTVRSTPPTMQSYNMFMNTPISDSSYLGYFGSIYVNASLLSKFQTATNWVRYSARMVGLTDEEIAALPF